MTKLRLSGCKIICVDHIEKFIGEHQTNFILFLINSTPDNIPSFKLRFNGFIKPTKYLEPLSMVLPRVQKQIYLNQFVLDSSSLKCFIEYSRNCEDLAIYDCKVDLSEEFELDSSLDYKFTILNMSMTIVDPDSDNDRINPDNLSIFVKALAETNLKSTLKTVYLWESYYRNPADVQQMFNDHGFNIKWKEDP